MKLFPLRLGEKENKILCAGEKKEDFLDPLTKFIALHDNDIEILLLVGKEKVTGLGSAELNFLLRKVLMISRPILV